LNPPSNDGGFGPAIQNTILEFTALLKGFLKVDQEIHYGDEAHQALDRTALTGLMASTLG
jgi:hypothetical protein